MASSPLDSRASRLLRASRDTFDIVVIGGGAFGAAAARSAALRGLRTLLLEARDYSAGTSSRSSKLLHGGVRYLEQGDVGLVAEALAERATMFSAAPHLTRPTPFLFPIVRGRTRPMWQVRLGLGLYDLLARHATRRNRERALPSHSRLSDADPVVRRLAEFGLRNDGVLQYFDGQMDDARIVVETALDAEAAGAIVLNHARVESLKRVGPAGANSWQIFWRDTCSQVLNESNARGVINAAGAGLQTIHEMFEPWPAEWPIPQLTRGTHLLFNVSLELPPMILPTGEAGRYYFVLPHFSPGANATLVGTTDVAVATGEEGETPSEQEVAELLQFLARDLPQANLNGSTLFHRFAGTRVLAGATAGRKTSSLRRSEHFLERPGYVTVLGGKYTTSRHIGEQLVDRVSGKTSPPVGRALRGGLNFDRDRIKHDVISALAKLHPAATEDVALHGEIDRAIARFGACAPSVLEYLPEDGESLRSQFYRAQIRYSICVEHALEIEDVIDRRLSLWPNPDERVAASLLVAEEFQRLGLLREFVTNC